MRRFAEVRIGDILLILFLVILSAVLMLAPMRGTLAGDAVEIVCAATGESNIYSLTESRSLDISSRGISLTVVINEGEVCVASADCPDQICRHSRAISRAGQSIVCAPAGIVIRIVGEEVDADAISG